MCRKVGFSCCKLWLQYFMTKIVTNNTQFYPLTLLITTLETISTLSKRNTMLTQVAQSKGTEWMVSCYNTWQQCSPLGNMPPPKTSLLNQLNESLTLKEERPRRIIALSFKSLLLILGLILSIKSK